MKTLKIAARSVQQFSMAQRLRAYSNMNTSLLNTSRLFSCERIWKALLITSYEYITELNNVSFNFANWNTTANLVVDADIKHA
jgi:hypothetical protein